MHRFKYRGGRHFGGHWESMRGRHGMHGGWGPPGGGRRRRMRRGDVRAAVLVLLDEGPMTGYALMGEIERRSDGAWRPSPGSVYPTLALLEDEGLIRPQPGEGRTPYELTDEGKAHVEEHREQLGEPWTKSAEGFGESRLELRSLIGQLGAAARWRWPATTPRSSAPRRSSARRAATSTASSRTRSRPTQRSERRRVAPPGYHRRSPERWPSG
jgi:DNA-binding PadR family transcriptional regulator